MPTGFLSRASRTASIMCGPGWDGRVETVSTELSWQIVQSPCLRLNPRLSITNYTILAHYLNSLCLVLLICKMGIIVPPSEGCVRMERNNISLEQPLISVSSIIIIIIVSTIITIISLAAAASPSIPGH